MQTIAFSVPGMSCAHCVAALNEELAKVSGVDTVAIDLKSKRAAVNGEGIEPETLWTAVVEAGYEAVAL